MYVVKRSSHNPILVPNKDHYWEAGAVFNLSPIKEGKNYYGIYRAISAVDKMRNPEQTSVVGIGRGKDGTHFEEHEQFIVPVEDWEKYGCEDPRVTKFEGKYYTFYTALGGFPFSHENIKVAVGISKDLKNVTERHLVTPFNAKAATLFPERINGKATLILTVHTDLPPSQIAIAQSKNVEDFWNPEFWEKWYAEIDEHTIDPRRTKSDHVEIGATPIKTKYGWLLIYSHIQNYFESNEHLDRIFGVEVLLLDLKDPRKIIGRTKGPILVPSEVYELTGHIGNIVFPSGALLEGDVLSIYYGAADTTVCKAKVNITDLINTIRPETAGVYTFKRWKENPIISPIEDHLWESKATFNPAAIRIGGTTHIMYRSFSNDNTSYIGYASTKNGVKIDYRSPEPIYLPREDFESKKITNGNSGCEDPRVTQIGKNIYMCYTAYDSINVPRVAITSITEKNFLAHNWKWDKPSLITPSGFDDKDACIFPEKFKDGYLVIHRVGNQVCGDYLHSLNFEKEKVNKCIQIFGPRQNKWDGLKVGIASPPINTKYGWLLIYHGVSKSHSTYRVGAVLLDKKDPALVLARTTDPIFEPEMDYEKNGIVNNVVFPCGVVEDKGILYLYYGGGDKVTGVATMGLESLLKVLIRGIEK
ncbi:MAG: hypothetical protein NTX85_01410 [Candidatus Nomurabacteria bacterium]|nr:hypothetical protein [Candidatus Nomurabacteria bacterium]